MMWAGGSLLSWIALWVALENNQGLGSDEIRTEALYCLFEAFSSREPASTSLENAMGDAP
jgi:hypothetical protein